MPSLKDLRIRINSVRQTQKITSAMKMVAASKLRRAQERAEAARPYADRMERMMVSLGLRSVDHEGAPAILKGTGKDEVHLIIVATAERGLCGGFNSSIVRAARRRIAELEKAGKTVKILCVGRKGRDQLIRQYGELILDTIEMKGLKQIGFADTKPISDRVLTAFENGEFDVCTIFHSRFKSVMSQIVTPQQLIPVSLAEAPEDEAEAGTAGDLAIYEYEPGEEEILAELLPRNVAVQIFRAMLENAASEQGARMTAMDSATRNAGDMIDKLTLHYNRTRQAAITSELIEIISGAEAV